MVFIIIIILTFVRIIISYSFSDLTRGTEVLLPLFVMETPHRGISEANLKLTPLPKTFPSLCFPHVQKQKVSFLS